MKKIMFNDRYGLTKAVLEGRKTMMRRIVPECKELDILRHWEHNEGAIATGYEEKSQSFRFDYCPDKKRRISIDHLNLYPKYKAGEVVAVARSYEDIGISPDRDIIHVRLAKTFDRYRAPSTDVCFVQKASEDAGWSNKMFVLADLMPDRIRITGVRIERLQDISEEDCMKEGIIRFTCNLYEFRGVCYSFNGDTTKVGTVKTPRAAFAALIDKVSGKGTWESNPWVFVYEFELVK